MLSSRRDSTQANPLAHPIAFVGRLLDDVRDKKLQAGIVAVLEAAELGLRALRTIDIEQFELDPRLEDGLVIWPLIADSAMGFMERLEAVASLIPEYFIKEYSTSDISDLDLELALEDLASGVPSPVRDPYELRLDQIYSGVSKTDHRTMRNAIAELGELLQKTTKEHFIRLNNPFLRRDGLCLVEDVHELCCRSGRMLETLIAVVLRGLVVEAPVSEVFPEYLTGGERSAHIRAWAVDFLGELDHLQQGESPDGIFHGAAALVAKTARRPEIGWLRSADRAVFQGFRRWLRAGGTPALSEVSAQLQKLMEWAGGMHRINCRAILLVHDIETIEQLCTSIDSSFRGPALLPLMEGLYGRSKAFDEFVREARAGHWASPRTLLPHLEDMRNEISQVARARTERT
ncbi:MAG: hypothetical protein KTR25_09845 [Myxococcales bacterium]|nr:hypothetical protein [Myxococcales bacterium]